MNIPRRFVCLAALCATVSLGVSAIATAAPAPKGELVLVAGATGRTGQHVVEQLLERGYRVRALVRDVERAKSELPAATELVAGDVRNADTLPAAVRGVARIVSAVGGGTGRNDPANNARTVDFEGIRNLAQAAKAAGVRQVVLVSATSVTRPDSSPAEFMRPILAAKFEGEEALRKSGVPYTVVRPGALLNEPAGRVGIRFAQGDTLESRINRADLAWVCVEALGRPEALNVTFEVTGVPGEPPPKDWKPLFAALKRGE